MTSVAGTFPDTLGPAAPQQQHQGLPQPGVAPQQQDHDFQLPVVAVPLLGLVVAEYVSPSAGGEVGSDRGRRNARRTGWRSLWSRAAAVLVQE